MAVLCGKLLAIFLVVLATVVCNSKILDLHSDYHFKNKNTFLSDGNFSFQIVETDHIISLSGFLIKVNDTTALKLVGKFIGPYYFVHDADDRIPSVRVLNTILG